MKLSIEEKMHLIVAMESSSEDPESEDGDEMEEDEGCFKHVK